MLTHLSRGFIVPQVHIYAAEGFEEVDESFFGFMTRDGEQAGQPAVRPWVRFLLTQDRECRPLRRIRRPAYI